MQFDNLTAATYILGTGQVIAASASNVVVPNADVARSDVRSTLNQLLRQNKISIDVLPTGYVLRKVGVGAYPELVATGAAQAGLTFGFTIGAEVGNAITVTVKALDGVGNQLADARVFDAYFSDASTGIGVVATANTTVAAGAKGSLEELVADKMLVLHTDVNGEVEVAVGQTGVKTTYLVVVHPETGDLVVSGAITFA